jgi:ketosteroid isomerase-like protein
MANRMPAEAGSRWTVESFAGFWKKPDASRVLGVLTEDVVGYWPRPIRVVRGAPAYVNVIAAIIEVCPDFTVGVAEHAATGDLTFIRWVATGTGPEGRFEFSGVDRVQTRNGLVCENRIYSDDPFFARVAVKIASRA